MFLNQNINFFKKIFFSYKNDLFLFLKGFNTPLVHRV
jgi:hypothetical protein